MILNLQVHRVLHTSQKMTAIEQKAYTQEVLYIAQMAEIVVQNAQWTWIMRV